MRTKIKVCGITSEKDARLALDCGADYLGIIAYEKSPRHAPRENIKPLLEFIPQGKRVFVDVSTPTDTLDEVRKWGFDHYQIHFDLQISMASVAGWSGLVGMDHLWAAPRIPPDEFYFPQVIMEFSETILVDSYSKEVYGGSGNAGGNWQRFLDCKTLYSHKSWVLAGGLNPHNIRDALAFTDAEMIDVNSGVESEPGIKDPELLRAFFENVRTHDEAKSEDS